MRLVYLNGEIIPQDEARISVMDRGFLFADAVYEVIPVYQGKCFRLSEHLNRLNQSLRSVHLDITHTFQQWENIICTLVEKNGGGNQAIYLQVSRGPAPTRSHAIPEQVTPTILLLSSPLTSPSLVQLNNPICASAICLDDTRWSHCDIKSTALLASILLSEEARNAGADEAILFRNSLLTEGTSSNVFVVKEGVVYTSPKSQFILGGITRDLLIELIAQHHIEYREQAVSREQLESADELWLTSSTREIAPVTQLNGKQFNDGQPGPLWKRVAGLYITYKRTLFEPEETII